MSDTPYTVPKEPGRWRAITLAALVHLALLVFLWIGIRWQNETPATVEAEVWSMTAKEAAPRPQPPEPVKQPEPEPKPVVKETPKPPPVEEKPVEKPDIALEQEKKRKAEEQKKRELEERRLAELKKRKEEEERERQEKLAEQKRIEKEKADKAAKEKKLAEEKRLAEEKKRRQEEAEQKMMAQAREAEMRRITGGVAGSGGQGQAEKSQGGRADAGYLGKVAARIKSNTVFNVPEGLSGNPAVEYAVELLPDGSLRGTPRKLKPSGVPGFDEAVLRAIEKSQPFPRDDRSGSVPSRINIVHRPKDQ